MGERRHHQAARWNTENMIEPMFTIENKTKQTLKVLSSIPEASQPSIITMRAGDKMTWLRQNSITSLVIMESSA